MSEVRRLFDEWKARAKKAEAACKAAVDNAMELARERDYWHAEYDKAEARVRELEARFAQSLPPPDVEALRDWIKHIEARNAKLEAVAEAARGVRDDERRVAESWQMWETEPLYLRLHSALEALDAAKGGATSAPSAPESDASAPRDSSPPGGPIPPTSPPSPESSSSATP